MRKSLLAVVGSSKNIIG